MIPFLDIFFTTFMKASESRKITWALWWSVSAGPELRELDCEGRHASCPPALMRTTHRTGWVWKERGCIDSSPPLLHGPLLSLLTPAWPSNLCHLFSKQCLTNSTSVIHFLHHWVLSWLVERSGGRANLYKCMNSAHCMNVAHCLNQLHTTWMWHTAIIFTVVDACLPKGYF